jgi:hypothetical protein
MIQKGDNIDNWLLNLESTFNECQRKKLPLSIGIYPSMDFLASIRDVSPEFFNEWNAKIIYNETNGISSKDTNFLNLVQLYRNIRRFTMARKPVRATHSAFATLNGREANEQPTPTPSTTPTTKPPTDKRACFCGMKHRWAKCFYLNESIRPSWWTPQENIFKKIKDEMEAKPELKERAKQAVKDFNDSNDTTQKASTMSTTTLGVAPEGTKSIFMAHRIMARSSEQYHMSLVNSFILDTGADGHVCNNRSRFVDFKEATEEQFIAAGTECLPIEGWGTIRINTKCQGLRTGQRQVTITNVAYIPAFHTNVISYHILQAQGWNWQINDGWILFQGLKYCQTTKHKRMWTLEYQPLSCDTITAFPARKSTALPKPKAKPSSQAKAKPRKQNVKYDKGETTLLSNPRSNFQEKGLTNQSKRLYRSAQPKPLYKSMQQPKGPETWTQNQEQGIKPKRLGITSFLPNWEGGNWSRRQQAGLRQQHPTTHIFSS